jgi:hypothetical protein
LKLDRKYQLELLQMLEESYPQCFDIRPHMKSLDGDGNKRYEANMVYLHEHGLIESGIRFGADGTSFASSLPRITQKGIDFLADDGGLSAILGVVTIKIHDETLKQLISLKIEQSDLPPADKGLWLQAVRSLPAETTKHLAMKLLDLGLTHSPSALQLVGTMLGFPQ